MAKFVFDNCCFCVELRVGSLIIGYLNLVVCIIGIIFSIIAIVGGASMSSSGDEDIKGFAVQLVAVGIISLLITTVLLALVIVLLVGLHKNKPGHVKAYLIYSYIYLLISLINLIVTLVNGHSDGRTVASKTVTLLINMYFVMVIRSYYHKMLDKSPTPLQYNA